MILKNLFSPIKLGNINIPNRTVMAPMGTRIYSADGTWPKRVIRYFEERAIGEIGLIITSFVRVHGSLASFPLHGIYDDRFIPSHRELVERIHRYDSKIFLQIALSGGKRSGEAPSSIYSPNYEVKPRALTTNELDELVESFISAAGRAQKSGYDGVELHGAHSYLVGQMMSPALNKRTDKYGGSFENRMKFPTDIITGIVRNFLDFPVGFKFSAHEELPGGIDIEQAKEIALHIAGLGVAYLHVASTASTINVFSKYPSVPAIYTPRNTLVPLAAEIKKTVPDIPVIATGSIIIPEEADEFIDSGFCDMVALGRTTFADPHWARKARTSQNIVPCIRCNVCYHQKTSFQCSVNPYLMKEAEQETPLPSKKKNVMVIGAGPAGLRCALTAACRGHSVTLFEKLPHIGGMVYPGSRPECKADMARLLDWFERELAESSVILKLNTEVTTEMVEREAPDALVIAVGAVPIIPDIDGIDKPHVSAAADVLNDISSYHGEKAVVIGGGDVGCETACHLADNGWEVTIVEKLPRLMSDNVLIGMKDHMFALLEKKQVLVKTETSLNVVIDEGVEVLLPNGKACGIEADLVVIAVGYTTPYTLEKTQRGVVGDMASKVEEVYIIGDCESPGRICDATDVGERIGRWI